MTLFLCFTFIVVIQLNKRKRKLKMKIENNLAVLLSHDSLYTNIEDFISLLILIALRLFWGHPESNERALANPKSEAFIMVVSKIVVI